MTTLTGTSPTLTGGFVVTAASTVLAFTALPSEAEAGSVFVSPVIVQVKDGSGNIVTTSTMAVTLSITPGTGTNGAILSGTTTVNAVSGVATFGNLKIDRAGTGYTLTATGGTVTSAISQVIKVLHPGDANLDTKLNMGDVTKVERIILGLDSRTCSCDANGDGKINMADVTKIERIILGLDPLIG